MSAGMSNVCYVNCCGGVGFLLHFLDNCILVIRSDLYVVIEAYRGFFPQHPKLSLD